MANSIITVPGLEIFAAEIEESCPILEDCRTTNKGLRGREGGKLKVAIPDPGHTFVKKGGIRPSAPAATSKTFPSRNFSVNSPYALPPTLAP